MEVRCLVFGFHFDYAWFDKLTTFRQAQCIASQCKLCLELPEAEALEAVFVVLGVEGVFGDYAKWRYAKWRNS